MLLSLLSWLPCVVVSSWFMAETKLSCAGSPVTKMQFQHAVYVDILRGNTYITLKIAYPMVSNNWYTISITFWNIGPNNSLADLLNHSFFLHWLIVILCQNRKNIHRIYTIVIYFMFKCLLLIIIRMYICMCMHNYPLVLEGDWYQDHPPTPP